MPLSNLEIHWVVSEMQAMVGSHFDRISDLDSGWKMKFGKTEVVADVPERIHITRLKQDAREPRGFTQYLRKHLRGRLVGVKQPNFDRVVVFEFDSGKMLVFEMFAKGNAILVDEGGRIEKTLRDEQWSTRSNKRGEDYRLPPSEKLDPREMREGEFNLLFGGGKDVIHSLVSGINMSGKYLEQACEEAGVGKNSMEPGPGLFSAIKGMVENPKLFSEELDGANATREADRGKSERVERKIAQQEGAIAELERKAEEAKERGDMVYSNWQRIEGIVKEIGELRKKGKNYGEINKIMAGKALINEKTQKMTLKL